MPAQSNRVLAVVRVAFGVALLLAWTCETVLWVASTVHLAASGKTSAVITAVATLLLLALLGCMEGLEVSVIDRWRSLFTVPAELASWLSARQLFVALIVTSTTLLAHRSVIVVPFTGARVTGGVLASVFDLTWTGFAVLWFAQIVPKALAATNPDGYLKFLKKPLWPVVLFVRAIGVTKPGEWAAAGLSGVIGWTPKTQAELAATHERQEKDGAAAWASITSEELRRKDEQTVGSLTPRLAGDGVEGRAEQEAQDAPPAGNPDEPGAS
jgi:hypothetical protein